MEHRLSDADSDDFDLSSANAYRPSSMAVSLLVRIPEGSELAVMATGGRYAIKDVVLIGNEREWWLRSPVRLNSRFRRADFPDSTSRYVGAHEPVRENVDNLNVDIELFARRQSRPDEFLITVCLVNRQSADGRLDLQSLFQCRVDIKLGAGSTGSILPYPTAEPLDSEERSQELLYRDKLTFAVGHGVRGSLAARRRSQPQHKVFRPNACLYSRRRVLHRISVPVAGGRSLRLCGRWRALIPPPMASLSLTQLSTNMRRGSSSRKIA